MNNRKLLFTPLFIFLPLVVTNINRGSATINSSVSTNVTGENTRVETKIETNINGSQTTVESNKSGSISVVTKDGKTEIKTSGNITPTIIIKNETITPIMEKDNQITVQETGEQKLFQDLIIPLKRVFNQFLNLFRRQGQ